MEPRGRLRVKRREKGTGDVPHGKRIRRKGTMAMMMMMTLTLGVEKKEQAEADAEKLGEWDPRAASISDTVRTIVLLAHERLSHPPAVYGRYRYYACAEWVQPRQSPRGWMSRTPAGSRQRRLRLDFLPLSTGLRPMRTPLRAWDRSGWLFRQDRIGHWTSLRLNRASLLP